METSNLIKVAAAFVGGVVVALGSALIYVRATEMMRPQLPVESTATVQQAQSSVPETLPDQAASDQTDKAQAHNQADQPAQAENQAPSHKQTASIHSPAVHPKTHRLVASTRVPVHVDSVAQKHVPASPAAEISQGSPPSAAPPAPAVEGSQSSVSLPQGDPSYTTAGSTQPSYGSAPVPAPQAQTPYQAPAQYNAPVSYSAPAAEPYQQPHVVRLPSGTNLVIRLLETLSTDHNYTGDTFRGTLESPIIMDGFIIADRGSKVLGRIASAQKPGRVEGLADLVLTLTEINTTDGQRVRIETNSYDKKGPTSAGEDVAKIAGGAALGAIIGGAAGGGKGAAIGAGAGGAVGTGAVMATRGKPAVLPTETRITFHLTSPVTITEKLNN